MIIYTSSWIPGKAQETTCLNTSPGFPHQYQHQIPWLSLDKKMIFHDYLYLDYLKRNTQKKTLIPHLACIFKITICKAGYGTLIKIKIKFHDNFFNFEDFFILPNFHNFSMISNFSRFFQDCGNPASLGVFISDRTWERKQMTYYSYWRI